MNDPLVVEALRKLNEAAELLRLVLANKELAADGALSDDMINWSFLDTQLNQIDFGPGYTVRLRNMFKHHRTLTLNGYIDMPLATVRDLVAMEECEVLREPNIGRQCLNRLKAMLEPHGLHFGMRFPMDAIARQVDCAVQ